MSQSLRLSQTIVLAFSIFAIFFGAGNLIFPPIVGFQSGENSLAAVLGFLLIAVGLPTLSTVAFATIEGNVGSITDKISTKFTFVYTCAIYLLIGPMFAIPRTAIVANEMAVVPFVSEYTSLSMVLLIFSFLYFLSIYLFCIYSTKVIEIVSKYIIPLLLFTVLLLIAGAIIWPVSTAGEPLGNFYANPLITGMLDGFLTMDSLGTFIIVSIVITRLNEMGITESPAIIKYTIRAGILSGIALCVVYAGLAYIGITSDVPITTTNGGLILVRSAMNSFGLIGMILLAISVFIACFTTALTLIIGASRFFHKTFPSISEKNFLRACVLFSFLVSNLGFDVLMSITVPVLDIAYPITILVVAFTMFRNHINGITSKIGMLVCCIVSIAFILYEHVGMKYENFGMDLPIFPMIPLFSEGLGWVIPTTIAVVITMVATKSRD